MPSPRADSVEDFDPDTYEIPRSSVLEPYQVIAAMLRGMGIGQSPFDPCESSYHFVKKYGLTLDGRLIDMEHRYKHLKRVYQDDHDHQVFMAGAQTGKTGRVFVFIARTAFGRAWGQRIGYYFPDALLPVIFSRDRFRPFLASNPDLAKQVGVPRELAGDKKKGVDNVLAMNLGETMIYFLTIGGRTSTEGVPLPAVFFDEVRKMEHGDIERAQERYSAQEHPIDVKVSTANYPKTDIHHYFLQSDQQHFHTECKCPSGIVLSLRFPDCIADLRHATPEFKRKVAHAYSHAGLPAPDEDRYVPAAFVCPDCGTIITDPREGWWEPHAPENWPRGWQMPQMLSPTYTAGRCLQKYERARDMQEVYNSMLGIPYVDTDKMPVKREHVDACVRAELVWGEAMSDAERETKMVNTGMGVDIQAGYAIAVIKIMAPNRKHRTVHVEVVERPPGEASFWDRLDQLMDRYDVRLAIVDEMPELTPSLHFVKRWPGRAFLGNYWLSDKAPRSVAWEDEALGHDDKQKGKETEYRHRVSMKRTAILHWGCTRWVKRLNEVPSLKWPTQILPRANGEPVLSAHLRLGLRAPVAVADELYAEHQTRWVFRDVYEGDEKKLSIGMTKRVAEYVGGDPHFSHADTWASVALDRIGKSGRVKQI